MEVCRFASRAARGGLATATALPTRLPARMAAISRPFSTTVPRLALPPPPPPPPLTRTTTSSAGSTGTPTTTSAAAPWPPSRDLSQPAVTPAAAAAAPGAGLRKGTGSAAASAADPLKDLYSSENPAQWALWSTDDFYKRHLGSSSSGGDSPKQHLRLRPTTGRTVHVSGNVDQARAFVLAEALVRRNSIKNDHYRQRFHERPGLRRKRLRSQRWGKRFRDNFVATAKRVQELAAQGW